MHTYCPFHKLKKLLSKMVRQNAIIAIVLVALFAFISIIAYGIFWLRKRATESIYSDEALADSGPGLEASHGRRHGTQRRERPYGLAVHEPPPLELMHLRRGQGRHPHVHLEREEVGQGREEVPPIIIRGLPRSP